MGTFVVSKYLKMLVYKPVIFREQCTEVGNCTEKY